MSWAPRLTRSLSSIPRSSSRGKARFLTCSLLKRGIIGTWHKISAKHLPPYLAEMEFRFNHLEAG